MRCWEQKEMEAGYGGRPGAAGGGRLVETKRDETTKETHRGRGRTQRLKLRRTRMRACKIIPPKATLEPDRKAGGHAGVVGEPHAAEAAVPSTPSG